VSTIYGAVPPSCITSWRDMEGLEVIRRVFGRLTGISREKRA